MRHVYNAYAAVHNPEVKKSLEESRDAFSKMNLNQLNDQDLYEVSEEILEKVFFHHDLDVPTAESLIEAILSDAIAGDKSPLRLDKIERLTESFASAFARVKEKSIRVAKESYTDYRYKKDQLARLSNSTDLDLPKQRLHQSLVAEDRKTVKSGLLEIIEGKVNAGLQAYLDKKKGKKTDDKEENGNGKSSKGGKPDFLDLDKDGDKKESMKKAAKDKKLKEAMIVTNADKKANTPAYQNYKKGMKNKKGEPVYKAADHMKEEEAIDEKMNAGLQAYIDKKKGKKTDDKEENGNGKNGKASKGSKPDFLDLDGDGNKTEPMKSASKSKTEETEYNYVSQYLENAPRMQKGAMAYDGPNKAASEAKDRVMAKAKARKKPTVTIDKPDKFSNLMLRENTR